MSIFTTIQHGIEARQKLGIPEHEVDAKTISERRKICKPCGFKRLGLCTKCGCPINDKTRLKSESCPVGKWSKMEN